MSDETTSGAAGAAEEEAWAELRTRWDDPLAHRAFLSRFGDLEALARAGARYRAVLATTPDDPVAAAGRDEVLRKATILGLAALPRTAPPSRDSPWVKRSAIGLLVLVLVGAAAIAWAVTVLLRIGAAR